MEPGAGKVQVDVDAPRGLTGPLPKGMTGELMRQTAALDVTRMSCEQVNTTVAGIFASVECLGT